MSNNKTKYRTVSISVDLYNMARTIAKLSPRYTSLSEFVKEAIRDKIKQSLEIDENLRQFFRNRKIMQTE